MSFGNGNGGSSSIQGATDVFLANPSQGEVLAYDTATLKWTNDAVTATGDSAVSVGTEVYFSSLTGANDDAKLASFMATQSAQALKGKTLVLDEARDYTFTQQQTLYSGFSIRGALRPQDQARGSRPIGNRIVLRMAGGVKGWFILPASGSVFGVAITNLSIDGDSNSLLVEGTSAVLWTSVFRDISIQNARGVLGRPSRTLLLTACTIDGWWNVNNVQERAFCLGGSDVYFTPSMLLLDSPAELLGPTNYLSSLSYQSNAWISNIYCTAEGHAALLLEGGSNDDSVWIKDCVFEGRNAGAPSPGALIRMTGGQYTFRDNRFAFAMTNPTLTGRNDAGVIHISGGTLNIDGATYRRATGVDEAVPFLYASGTSTRVRVRNVTKLGSWMGKPIVQQATAGLIDADDTVTLITG